MQASHQRQPEMFLGLKDSCLEVNIAPRYKTNYLDYIRISLKRVKVPRVHCQGGLPVSAKGLLIQALETP